MAYSGPYGPPQVDFSGFNPVGSFEQGASLRRSYELRKGLSKIAPDDFQGMARLLAQFGEPKDAVNMMQLQYQLQHQGFQDKLATEQLAATKEVQKSLIESRGQRNELLLEEKAAPYRALQSGIPTYAKVRDSIYDAPGVAVGQGLLGGGPLDQINAFAVTVGEALHKKDPKAYAAAVTPTKTELTSGTAAAKFAQLERDAATAREIGSSTFDLTIPEIPAYVKKDVPAPQAGHAAPNAARRAAASPPPPAGAVPPPVTVSPPGLNQEGAFGAEVQPHAVRTVPQIAPGSPQETEALRQARDNIAAHPNDKEYAKRIIQKLLDMGVRPDKIGMGQP